MMSCRGYRCAWCSRSGCAVPCRLMRSALSQSRRCGSLRSRLAARLQVRNVSCHRCTRSAAAQVMAWNTLWPPECGCQSHKDPQWCLSIFPACDHACCSGCSMFGLLHLQTRHIGIRFASCTKISYCIGLQAARRPQPRQQSLRWRKRQHLWRCLNPPKQLRLGQSQHLRLSQSQRPCCHRLQRTRSPPRRAPLPRMPAAAARTMTPSSRASASSCTRRCVMQGLPCTAGCFSS
jgi:hypothetical protein